MTAPATVNTLAHVDPSRTVRERLLLLGARAPWALVLAASCVAVATTTYAWTSSPARPAVTTWFLLVCPGMALVRLLPARGAVTLLVLAVATSLALETLLAEAMLEATAWSPNATLAVLIALTATGAGIQWRRAMGRGTAPSTARSGESGDT
jgi:hypothetical protein